MDEADLHKQGLPPRDEELESLGDELPRASAELPEFELGRRVFPAAWSKAANEGLISDEEFVTELLRHTRAENERTMPGVSWPEGPA